MLGFRVSALFRLRTIGRINRIVYPGSEDFCYVRHRLIWSR